MDSHATDLIRLCGTLRKAVWTLEGGIATDNEQEVVNGLEEIERAWKRVREETWEWMGQREEWMEPVAKEGKE